MGDLRGDPCEYGCAGPCESWEHWRDRAEYLLVVGREWELRARYGTEAERRMRSALREALRAVEELREDRA